MELFRLFHAHKRECEEGGDYRGAQESGERLVLLRDRELTRQEEFIVSKHRAETEDLREGHLGERETFLSRWEEVELPAIRREIRGLRVSLGHKQSVEGGGLEDGQGGEGAVGPGGPKDRNSLGLGLVSSRGKDFGGRIKQTRFGGGKQGTRRAMGLDRGLGVDLDLRNLTQSAPAPGLRGSSGSQTVRTSAEEADLRRSMGLAAMTLSAPAGGTQRRRFTNANRRTTTTRRVTSARARTSGGVCAGTSSATTSTSEAPQLHTPRAQTARGAGDGLQSSQVQDLDLPQQALALAAETPRDIKFSPAVLNLEQRLRRLGKMSRYREAQQVETEIFDRKRDEIAKYWDEKSKQEGKRRDLVVRKQRKETGFVEGKIRTLKLMACREQQNQWDALLKRQGREVQSLEARQSDERKALHRKQQFLRNHFGDAAGAEDGFGTIGTVSGAASIAGSRAGSKRASQMGAGAMGSMAIRGSWS